MTDRRSHIILFNDERYQRHNLRPNHRLFRYDHLLGGRLVGTFSGVAKNELFDCGYSAPFGGIDCACPEESPGAIIDLLRAGIVRARAEGIRDVRIRARPAYFGANEAAIGFALHGLGASVESCELSLGLETWRFRTPEQYEATLRRSARKQLHQGLRAGMVFAPAETGNDWSACFDLLVESRRRRDVSLKFSLAYVMELRNIFGERITMHRLHEGDDLAAAALVYRVRRDWDYVVAWGDEFAFRGKRVMNLMAYHLVCWAIAEGVAIVDLGISSVVGVPDDGLIHFKRGIGAATGARLNFRLHI
jgi:hypothetical protein